MKRRFRFWVGVSLVLVYGVIAAGAIVRMTGSGMGCPDWPKCFGYLIPPTERSQLDWKPQHNYEKGQVIIVNENLRVAKNDFTSFEKYAPEYWEPYTKHDYAVFNPFHTWVEFLNRLLGALSGLATLAVGILAFGYRKERPLILLCSWAVIFGMGFQAWLGKTVVDSNLLPLKISLHMGMALVIVALLLYLYFISKNNKPESKPSKQLNRLGIGLLLLTLVQIALGTQVRQFIDEQVHLSIAKEAWLDPAPFTFYFHRSFSLVVTALNIYLWWKLKSIPGLLRYYTPVLYLIGSEIITGILMYYFDFPFASQPLHLLIASLLFGAQTYYLLHAFYRQKNSL